MAQPKSTDLTVACPCCGATLTIDTAYSKVIAHEAAPHKPAHAPDLEHADDLLRAQAARREAIFKQSAEDEKSKSHVLERKFEEALKKSKDQPITRPTRDIDL